MDAHSPDHLEKNVLSLLVKWMNKYISDLCNTEKLLLRHVYWNRCTLNNLTDVIVTYVAIHRNAVSLIFLMKGYLPDLCSHHNAGCPCILNWFAHLPVWPIRLPKERLYISVHWNEGPRWQSGNTRLPPLQPGFDPHHGRKWESW